MNNSHRKPFKIEVLLRMVKLMIHFAKYINKYYFNFAPKKIVI
jgi:hypothetical protein